MTKRCGGREQKLAQLRGDALIARIRNAVREFVNEMGDRLDPQRVSMKAIAERVPCSRTTIHKYESVVSDALRDFGYRAARRTGEARAEALAFRSELYRQEVEALRAELTALRNHHTELYTRLLMHSMPAAALVREVAIAASHRDGQCILCGGEPLKGPPTNVVGLTTNGLPKQENERK